MVKAISGVNDNRQKGQFQIICKCTSLADANAKCQSAGLEAKIFRSQHYLNITEAASQNLLEALEHTDIVFRVDKVADQFISYEQLQDNLNCLNDCGVKTALTTPQKITQFSDIPMFTEEGGYTADMPFDQLVFWIDKQIEEQGLELCPDFQRGHVWTVEQQTAYIEFVLKGGKSGKVIYFNNPRKRCPSPTGYNDYVCVDGLQRITAIQRYMNNEIPAFGSLFKEYTDPLPILTAQVKVNINDLKSKADVLRWYIEMNSGGTVHTSEEINRVKAMLEEIA